MKRSHFIFKLFIFLFFTFNSSCQTSPTDCNKFNDEKYKNEYNTISIPSWFTEKPQIHGINLVYAYCSQYLNKDTEKKMLLLNAAEQAAKSRQVNIKILLKGKQQTGKYLGHTEIYESKPLIDEHELENNYTIIYKYSIGSGVIALAAETNNLESEHLLGIKNTMGEMNVSSPPKWISNPPNQKGFIYGVGSAQDHSSPEKAWNVAEKNARANIALQLNANLFYESKGIQRSMWEWVVIHHQICSSMMLIDVSIIKHGYCKTNRTYYALARMKQK